MQTALKIRLLSFFAITFLFFSCQQDLPIAEDVALDYIPEDISVLTVANVDQLMGKADFESVKEMDFYRSTLFNVKKDNAAFAKILEDPSLSGVDLNQNAYLAQEVDSQRIELSFSAVLLPLADVEAFQQMLTDIEMDFEPVSQGYGYLSQGSQARLVWNEEVAILGVTKKEEDIKAKLETYIQRKAGESVAANPNLRKLLATDFDLANWMKSDVLANRKDLFSASVFTNLDEETLKGNYLHSFVHFENGQIRSESYFYIKKKITNDLDLFFRNKVETDFTAAMPGNGLGLMLTAALSPKGFNQILVEKHVKGAADQQVKSFGITMEELINGLSGDVAIGLYPTEKYQDPNVVVIAKVEEKKTVQTLLEGLLKEEVIEDNGNGMYTIKGYTKEIESDTGMVQKNIKLDGHLLMVGDLLYVTSSPEKAELIQAGDFETQSPVIQALQPLMSANIFAMIANQDLLWMEDDFKNLGIIKMQATANRDQLEGILTLEDQSKNSLKTLMEQLNKSYVEHQKELEKEEGSKI